MAKVDSWEAWGAEYIESVANIGDAYRADTVNYDSAVFVDAVKDIDQVTQRILHGDERFTAETIKLLQAMCDPTRYDPVMIQQAEDGSLSRMDVKLWWEGQEPSEDTPGLIIYALDNGETGFNVDTTEADSRATSRRWQVRRDRGTQFGAAFDVLGVVYADGYFDFDPLVTVPTNLTKRHNGDIQEAARDQLIDAVSAFSHHGQVVSVSYF